MIPAVQLSALHTVRSDVGLSVNLHPQGALLALHAYLQSWDSHHLLRLPFAG